MQKPPEQQPQQSLTFNYQKISKFISTLQRQIAHIRLLCKKISKNNETSSQDITKIIQHKNQFLQVYNDPDKQRQRYFKKQLNNIDFVVLQKQQHQANDIWFKNNVDGWIEINSRVIQELNQKAKKLQSKRLNKVLKAQQIVEFKNQLVKTTAQYRKAVNDMIRSLSQWSIKNCCGLIENLTTTMQQSKMAEKKRENRKVEKHENQIKRAK